MEKNRYDREEEEEERRNKLYVQSEGMRTAIKFIDFHHGI